MSSSEKVSGNTEESRVLEFTNGKWFNGETFEEDTWYSQRGTLTRERPASIDSLIDLKGKFIVPPYGDAHTHNMDRSRQLPEKERKYLKEGVYYVQVLTNYASGANALRPYYAQSHTVDVSFANAGWTSTLGHPYLYYEPMELGFPAEDWKKHYDTLFTSRKAQNDAYFFADTADQVDSLWPLFMATDPDLAKIFLRDAKKHKALVYGDELNSIALSEPAAMRVATLAKRDSLRLFAHVESATDFQFCLDIGVNGFTHLPGFLWNGSSGDQSNIELTEGMIKEAGKRQLIIIPTLGVSEEYAVKFDSNLGKEVPDSERLERQQRYLHSTVRKLKEAGVRIALGSDHAPWSMTQIIEYHIEAGLFSPLELLQHLSVITPQTIFPKRDLGILGEGKPASFLVLNNNPIENGNALLDINLRIKQGEILKNK